MQLSGHLFSRMPISQNLNYSFLSYPEKRQGDNAIITLEETKVFEIENASFLSILKLYKTTDWGRVVDTNLYKRKTTSKYILLFFIFYLSISGAPAPIQTVLKA